MYSFFDGADAVCGQLPPADDERSRGERIDRQGLEGKDSGKEASYCSYHRSSIMQDSKMILRSYRIDRVVTEREILVDDVKPQQQLWAAESVKPQLPLDGSSSPNPSPICYAPPVRSGGATADELAAAVDFAHKRGAKVLLAINTFATAGDTAPWTRAVDTAAACGVDAIVVADLTVLDHAARQHPQLRLHLSVQAAAGTPEALHA